MVKWLLVWFVCVCISNLLCINFASVNYCDPFESIVDFITLGKTINKPPKLMLCKEKIIKFVYVKSTWVELAMFRVIEILKWNQIQIIWRIFISIKIKLMKRAWKRIRNENEFTFTEQCEHNQALVVRLCWQDIFGVWYASYGKMRIQSKSQWIFIVFSFVCFIRNLVGLYYTLSTAVYSISMIELVAEVGNELFFKLYYIFVIFGWNFLLQCNDNECQKPIRLVWFDLRFIIF